MTIDAGEALQIDLKAAERYAESYLRRVDTSITNRGLVMTSAIEEFNKFCALPEDSSTLGKIWDVAFVALSIAIPAFGLEAVLAKAGSRAATALAVSKRYGMAVAISTKVADAVAKTAPTIAKGVKSVDDVKSLYEKAADLRDSWAANDASGEIGDDVSFEPILKLIDERDALAKLYDDTMETIYRTWWRKLDDDATATESLESIAKGAFPAVDLPQSREDYKEVKTAILYELLLSYAKSGAIYYVDWDGAVRLEGLNERQLHQIAVWFGPNVRSTRFFKNPIYYIPSFLSTLGLKTVIETHWDDGMYDSLTTFAFSAPRRTGREAGQVNSSFLSWMSRPYEKGGGRLFA